MWIFVLISLQANAFVKKKKKSPHVHKYAYNTAWLYTHEDMK